VLAVTDVDLYADDLNFVFGIAQPSGEAEKPVSSRFSGSISTPTRSALAAAP
jgi:predicted Zn-dependent protease